MTGRQVLGILLLVSLAMWGVLVGAGFLIWDAVRS